MSDLSSRVALLTPEKRLLLDLLRKEKPGQRQTSVGRKDVGAALHGGTSSQSAANKSFKFGDDAVQTKPFMLISEEDYEKLPDGIEDAYPLSMIQLGMLTHMELRSDSPTPPAYHNVNSFHLRAPFNAEAIQEAVDRVVARHAVLRTSFDLNNYSEPVQLVHRTARLPVRMFDLRHLPPDDQRQSLKKFIEEENFKLFDLSRSPLLRYYIHRLTDETFQFTLTEPHSISDGWSTTLTLAEICNIYYGIISGQPVEDDKPLAVSFRDFILLERMAMESEECRRFWDEKLDNHEVTKLPRWPSSFHNRPTIEDHKLEFFIEPRVTDGLIHLARTAGVPLKSVLLAAHLKAMSMISGRDDTMTGLVFNGRPETLDGDKVHGLFLNTLPLRFTVNNGTWFDLARETYKAEIEILPYRRYPLTELQRKRGGQPLFEAAFSYLHFYSLKDTIGKIDAVGYGSSDLSVTNFPLMVTLHQSVRSASQLALVLEFDVTEFCKDQMLLLYTYYDKILTSMSADPATRHDSQCFLPAREQRQLLVECNDTYRDFSAPECLHHLFEAQVERSPHSIAAICGDSQLTFEGLNNRANQTANYLRSLGIGPESRVAIFMERSLDMIVALLGVLKAGGAYVPIDTQYPKDRVAFIIEDALAPVILTQSHLVELLLPQDGRVVCMESDWCKIAKHSSDDFDNRANADNLAYIIYTSGSTGKPKGAMISHRGLINYLSWCVEAYQVKEGDGSPVHSPIGFDLTITSLFSPLLVGRSVFLPEEQGVEALKSALTEDRNYSLIKLTPAHLELLGHQLLEEGRVSRAKRFIVGGEQFLNETAVLWQKLASDVVLINEYGPTETVVGCCVYEVPCDSQLTGAIPIGRPIANTQMYLLDSHMQPVPFGVAGEIYIGGHGVARGYHSRPELTGGTFVPNPFSDRPGARLYKTGDLGRYCPDSNIEFVGRIDDQVKIRGFRVELGEIEAVLAGHPGIQEAVVLTSEYAPDDRRLVAYLTPDPDSAFTVRQLLRFQSDQTTAGQLQYELPNGMVVVHNNEGETEYLYKEIFEDQVYLKHGIRVAEGDSIFDVGANIGMFSLFAGKRFKNVIIYAFEPIPRIFEMLRINTALYGLNVRLFQCGLADEAKTETFTHYPHLSLMSGRFANAAEDKEVVRSFELNRQSSLNRSATWTEIAMDETLAEWTTSETITCRLRTISEIIREHKIDRIALLKIDAEKSELDILNGIHAEDWKKIQQIVVEVHDIDGRVNRFKQLLESHDYELVIQQETALEGTDLYAIYAVRPSKSDLSQIRTYYLQSSDLERAWCNPDGLIRDVKGLLRNKLPDYMVPSAFVLLEAMPLTANGKIDRRSLTGQAIFSSELDANYVAPRTPIEEVLSSIFGEVLGREGVGIHDNFFDLGGHSLLVFQVVVRIRRVFNVSVRLRSLFDAPTIASLAKLVQSELSYGAQLEAPPIERVPRDRALPLSFGQQRLWFLEQLQPNTPVYIIPTAVRLEGELNFSALQRSVNEIVRRHEILRTTILDGEGSPVQVISPVADLPISVIDLRRLPAPARDIEAQRLTVQEAKEPFDLIRGPLLRMRLLRMDEGSNIALLTMHHIVSDGWSMEILIREIGALYDAFSHDQPSPLPELPIQYADFSLWQRESLQANLFESQLGYWTDQLKGSSFVSDLLTDRARPPLETFRGATQSITMPGRLAASLTQLSKQEGSTLFITLLAAFNVLLHRHSGQDDINVGTPIAGRNRTEVEDLIGLFINTLVLRTDLSADPTFRELMGRVREAALGAFAHQELPFEKLVERLQPQRDLSRSPLFQIMFVLHNTPSAEAALGGLRLSSLGADRGASKFDLTVSVRDAREGLVASFEYNTDLFDDSTIARMMERFRVLLEGIAANPDQRISLLPLLPENEREKLLKEWNDTRREYEEEEELLHEAIEGQAERRADGTAVVYQDQHLSYGEMNRRANRIAHELIREGVGVDSLVGVCMKRSLELVVTLLGILKAGGAYVPLDAEYPQKWLRYMVEDAEVKLVLTQEELVGRVGSSRVREVAVDREWEKWEEREENPRVEESGKNLAYMIYTSGTTGEPKGVGNTHEGIVNRLRWMQEEYELDERDRILQKTPMSFDVSVWEFFWGLMEGATIVEAEGGGQKESGYLVKVIKEEGITTMHFVPSMLQVMMEERGMKECRSLERVICSGEALPYELMKEAKKKMGGRLDNLYGPTEAAVDVSKWRCEERGERGRVSIGRPISNMRLYVLDGRKEPVGIGVGGELHIAGVGLARGYQGKAEMTAEKFIPDPYSEEVGGRMYRSGDMARWEEGGEIEYLGRKDEQVKIRGNRIELGEVEGAIREEGWVREAAVVVKEGVGGEKRLVGYIVKRGEEEKSWRELRERLSERLPEYMVPGIYVMLEEMPVTGSGKIDRKRLPEPSEKGREEGYEGASNEVEEELVRIWEEVLGVERVGIHDNFFELGGDSILSIRIVAKANTRGFKFLPRQIFQYQTIAELASVTKKSYPAEQGPEQGTITGSVPLTPIQQWFFEQSPANPHHWNQAVMFELGQTIEAVLLEKTVAALQVHHDALRLRFIPDGSGWRQINAGVESITAVSQVDISSLPPVRHRHAIEQAAANIQASLNIVEGPVIRVVMFNLGENRSSRLLIVIHHLVVDAVSWRILLEDLRTTYKQLTDGQAVQLPPKTTSFKLWAERLAEYAQTATLEHELSHWTSQKPSRTTPLPLDYSGGSEANTVASARTVSVSLDVEDTRALLRELPRTLHAQINEVLLAAIARVVGQWAGTKSVLADVEGHGREAVLADVDPSRTVGWFTSLFPVHIDLSNCVDSLNTLMSVKEQLRRIPMRGIGYGLLRYLNRDEEIKNALLGLPQPEIMFNYFGSFDEGLAQDSSFVIATESSGSAYSPAGRRTHLLEVTGGVGKGRLHMSWTYSENLHRRTTIESIAQAVIDELRSLIDQCCAFERPTYTPSDFPLSNLDARTLGTLVETYKGIEDIYPLSPLQQGFLFHSLYSSNSESYIIQLSATLQGELNVSAFERAWQQVLDRHSVLRSAFAWENLEEPLQVVQTGVRLNAEHLDWRSLSEHQRLEGLERLREEDRRRGFKVTQSPLMRLTLIRGAEDIHYFIWTQHHLLLDGWSMPLLLNEVVSFYEAFCAGINIEMARPRSYRDYIEWLRKQDLTNAEPFWRKMLSGFKGLAPLRIEKAADTLMDQEEGYGQVQLKLSKSATSALQALAQRYQLTFNTITQGAWLLLMGYYRDADDVVIGVTVSGRAPVLEGVESMIGMFINTLPVRARIHPDVHLVTWLTELQQQQLEILQYEHSPLVEVQGWSDMSRGVPLFDSIMTFENYPTPATSNTQQSTLQVSDARFTTNTHYAMTLLVEPGSQLALKLLYDRRRYKAAAVVQMLSNYELLLTGMAEQSGETLIHLLTILSEAEKRQRTEDEQKRKHTNINKFRTIEPKAIKVPAKGN